ncbi:Asp-tRNA(Asn)/Glu-tRNA(Gln) amidotransferase subunit GatB [Candidatus Woesearchaeota archaeon]|nr:Asp-tRNA(Asn)/Glu-tRNA(Gln) amidotransferase subunit GatB [Candidatus Woesearchaeota archaeon]
MNFETDIVIGLEIHVGLNTKSKLFCSCPNAKSDEPNVNVCPVCLGHPGSRPTMNKEVLFSAIKLAKALNFSIAPRLIFSRKTYFYPDLVKNFQITQFEEPIGSEGFIIINDRKIGLERVHIEEDPGALIHKSDSVLMDYNRSGTPLCEIVTKPELTSAKEAREFIKKLLVLIDYINIFDQDNGIVKADLNISIKETNYRRVEIKGVSGLKDIENALNYEISRQQENPNEVVQETRGYDSENRITFTQRSKEDAEDYGYIYEPDLVPRDITEDMVSFATSTMPVMVDERINNYVEKGMKYEDAQIITSIKDVSDLFERSVSLGIEFDFAMKFFKRDIISRINDKQIEYSRLKNETFEKEIVALLKLFSERKINNLSVKNILDKLSTEDIDVVKYANDNKLIIETNIDLESVCKEMIAKSEQAVLDYRSGKENALNFIVGQVMKVMKGAVMPDDVKNKIKEILG